MFLVLAWFIHRVPFGYLFNTLVTVILLVFFLELTFTNGPQKVVIIRRQVFHSFMKAVFILESLLPLCDDNYCWDFRLTVTRLTLPNSLSLRPDS